MSDGGGEPSRAGQVRLRPLTGEDVGQSLALLAQLGYEMTRDEAAARLQEVPSTSRHLVLCAEIDGRIAGLLHVFARLALENPREAVVQALVVDQSCRRAGVGRALMAEAECWGRENGCRSAVLSSNVVREPAHAFYRALGYRVSATAHIFRKPITEGGGRADV